MDKLEMYKKTDEIISKFKNGKELYHKSPMFNQVVQMLVRDVSFYDIIESIINSVDDTQRALEHHLMSSYKPIFTVHSQGICSYGCEIGKPCSAMCGQTICPEI